MIEYNELMLLINSCDFMVGKDDRGNSQVVETSIWESTRSKKYMVEIRLLYQVPYIIALPDDWLIKSTIRCCTNNIDVVTTFNDVSIINTVDEIKQVHDTSYLLYKVSQDEIVELWKLRN